MMLTGCVTPPNQLQPQKDLLTFLEDGKTQKEEVLVRLGQPASKLEGERILTYRIGGDEKRGFYLLEREQSSTHREMGAWWASKFSLVLVFDEKNVLRKRSLVQVR